MRELSEHPYDFDNVIDRHNTNSYKWNVGEDELALWVADMDFPTAPCVLRAVEKIAQRGIFGYADIPGAWAQSYVSWWKRRHAFEMDSEWLTFTSGAIAALSSIVRRITEPAEKVLVLTPVYNTFFNSILNQGRVALEVPLLYRGGNDSFSSLDEGFEKSGVGQSNINPCAKSGSSRASSSVKVSNATAGERTDAKAIENHPYAIDFEELERQLTNPQVTMIIICNPHNPIGRIWSKDELGRIGELCAEHGVIVVSDEVHCDVMCPGSHYVPFASISDTCRNNSISLLGPSKAFNLAGLQTAATCIPNEHLRRRVVRGLNNDEVAEPNVFAIEATMAAFNEGEEWLDAVCAYLEENRELATHKLKDISGIKLIPADASYLLWIDCNGLRKGTDGLCRELRDVAGVVLSNGRAYGKAGKGFLRLNLACPRSILEEALARIIPVLETRN